MRKGIDILFISPGNSRVIYQDLANEYTAIEPPIWAGLLAQFCRKKNYDTSIIDQEAQGLTSDQIAINAAELNPKITAIIVYGQQPSASTQNMTMAEEIAGKLKQFAPDTSSIMIGVHPSALPERTLEESETDFVCQGEGPYTLEGLVETTNLKDDTLLKKIPDLWFLQDGKCVFTFSGSVVPGKELPEVLPGMAWDLLPMDTYRAHNWHCFGHINDRKPYASLYTSLGCPYKCSFCCINTPFGKPSIRYWDPGFVINELDILANKYGVKNIKIADEMFVLQEDHVMRLCDQIIERGYDFNFWAYARVDTVKDKFLEKLKKAGFNWLALGVESKSKHVRDGSQKGNYSDQDIKDIVKKIQDAGIYVLANYIFGLPDDTHESMQETLDLAVELNCEGANFYSGMAYPGSKLYNISIEKGWALPKRWHDFSQHSYGQQPLPTEHLRAEEVLRFRDHAWQHYFTNPKYLSMLGEKFGQSAVDHISEVSSITLKRKLLEESPTP
tara:strand:- start:6944 stop:8443 length:1500 start_codon:yes stop_codon:yes gene_type:complete